MKKREIDWEWWLWVGVLVAVWLMGVLSGLMTGLVVWGGGDCE